MKAKRSKAFSLECLGHEVPHGMKDHLAKPEPVKEAASENTPRLLPLGARRGEDRRGSRYAQNHMHLCIFYSFYFFYSFYLVHLEFLCPKRYTFHMPQKVDNQQLANFLLSNKLASREQILEMWPQIATGKDIGALLVEKGIFPASIYEKAIQRFIQPTPPTTLAANPPQPQPQIKPIAPDTNNSQITVNPEINVNSTLNQMLAYGRAINASDIHMSPGLPLMARRFGVLTNLTSEPVYSDRVKSLIAAILTENQCNQLESKGDLEFVHTTPNKDRYRITLMKQRAGWDMAARCIASQIRTFAQAGIPESCTSLTQWAQGLVLVTGTGSSGKSSTLATLVELINQNRTDHIITLESPIEFLFTPAKCHITQREVGVHTQSQEAALRAALREDPDVIVVGELRDLSTMRLAVSAAETGHLVLGTMNTLCASRTIYRLIDSFPAEEQAAMRNMVSESLRGVIAQQLIPRLDGKGMAAAFEVLVVNSAVSNMIRKDEMHQLGTAMITGKASGMLLLHDSIRKLVAQGIISQHVAEKHGLANLPAPGRE